MIYLRFLEAIFESDVIKKAYENNIQILFIELKQVGNIINIESKLKYEGNIHSIEIFFNPANEFYTTFSCSCISYYNCSHSAAVFINFLKKNNFNQNFNQNDIRYYNYSVVEDKLKIDYQVKIKNWVLSYEEFGEWIYPFLENMSTTERELLYYLKKKGNFEIDSEVKKILNNIYISNNEKKVIEEDKIIIDEKDGKIIINSNNSEFEELNNKKVSPYLLFKTIPEYLKKYPEIITGKSIEKYILYIEKIECMLCVEKKDDENIFIIPEVIINEKKYIGKDIFEINTDYVFLNKYEYKIIDIDKYNNFIKFIKSYYIKQKETKFYCEVKDFLKKYDVIKKDWKIKGIYKDKIKTEIDIKINKNNGVIKQRYFIENKELSEKDIKNIQKNKLISKGEKLIYIENFDIKYENYVEDNVENIICKYYNFIKSNKINNKQKIYENITVEDKYKKILRNYQIEGMAWLKFIYTYGFSGILADDMGLGKTLQTIFFLDSIKEKGQKLIVVPKTLLYNWEDEIKKFLNTENYVVYDGSIEKRKKIFESIENKDIIIISYSILNKDIEYFLNIQWQYIVLDEAQYIKNKNTIIYKNLKKLKSDYRLALTGTPIENSIIEYQNIFDFLMPNYLIDVKKYNQDDAKEYLKYKTEPFILRRKKEDVLKELPPKIEQVIKIDMNERQKNEYFKIVESEKMKLYEDIEKNGLNKSYFNILAVLTYLRQYCNHPELIGKKNINSAKLELLEEIVEEALEGGHKIIIFSQFIKMLDIIEKTIQKKKIQYLKLIGETKYRNEMVKKFNETENIKIFLISLKAGGTGLNITSADTVILFDPWWNPMIEKQAMDRAYRIGQKRKVNVYKLITKDTIEEKILKIQEKKYEIFEELIEKTEKKHNKLTIKDIENILT